MNIKSKENKITVLGRKGCGLSGKNRHGDISDLQDASKPKSPIESL